MQNLLRSRISARHGAATETILDSLMRASGSPHDGFEILEAVVERDPELRRLLLRAANCAGRRAMEPIRTPRQALVRLGLRTASRVLLEATNRADPTIFDQAA